MKTLLILLMFATTGFAEVKIHYKNNWDCAELGKLSLRKFYNEFEMGVCLGSLGVANDVYARLLKEKKLGFTLVDSPEEADFVISTMYFLMDTGKIKIVNNSIFIGNTLYGDINFSKIKGMTIALIVSPGGEWNIGDKVFPSPSSKKKPKDVVKWMKKTYGN